MLGWQLRHDPNAQLPIPHLGSIRQPRRDQPDRRKLSHSTTTSDTSIIDDERRKLLPERRKTLATSTCTIPKDMYLIGAPAVSASTVPSFVLGSENEIDQDDERSRGFQVPIRKQYVPRDYSPYHRPTCVVRRQHAFSPGGVSTASSSIAGGLARAVILEEEASASGDYGRAKPFDFTYADQCELEDLLDRTGPGAGSTQVGDAYPLDSKDKDATQLDTTLQELSESKMEDESSESDESEGWKRQARLILPHVGLVILTCTYTLIGASIFYAIEQPHEQDVKHRSLEQIFRMEQEMFKELFHLARHDPKTSEEDWRKLSHEKLLNLTDLIYKSVDEYFLTSKEIRENSTLEIWSFPTAVFFAATVVTTIGYGSPVPVTFSGRLVCVFFALFGIPLTLLTIANVGKFFSEHLLWLYGCYLKLTQKLQTLAARFRKRSAHPTEGKHNMENHGPLICEKCRRPSAGSGEKRTSLSDIDFMDIQEKTVPASAVLSILIGYTALGGFIFCNIEHWDFFEAFYFSFITMTTIGFGDLVPKNSRIILILLYIVLGLAITTMCIDLVGAHYVRKIHYFGRKIQDARSALAIVGGKVVYVGELYAQLMQKRYGLTREQMELIPDAFIIENLYLTKHLIPFIPRDIKKIKYIDANSESWCSSSTTLDDGHSCRYCHGRMSVVSTTQTTYFKPPTLSQGRSPKRNRLQC